MRGKHEMVRALEAHIAKCPEETRQELEARVYFLEALLDIRNYLEFILTVLTPEKEDDEPLEFDPH